MASTTGSISTTVSQHLAAGVSPSELRDTMVEMLNDKIKQVEAGVFKTEADLIGLQSGFAEVRATVELLTAKEPELNTSSLTFALSKANAVARVALSTLSPAKARPAAPTAAVARLAATSASALEHAIREKASRSLPGKHIGINELLKLNLDDWEHAVVKATAKGLPPKDAQTMVVNIAVDLMTEALR